jgi:hypothetical protein
MIFLVGARRSGTNWLQRVVGAHPDVALVPSETYLFSRGIKPLRERFQHGVLGSWSTSFVYMDREELLDALRDLCDRAFLPYLEAKHGAARLAERTPEHVTCLDLIGEIYPDAHVVHIVRDGRDVVRSLLSQDWADAPQSIEAAAEEWRWCVDAAEDARASLRLYRTIRYEEMLADPLGQVTELYGWLGLSTTPTIVEGALLEAEVPFNVDAGAPVVAAGKWRESFTTDDLETFMRVAGPALDRLGYTTEDSTSARVSASTQPPHRSKPRAADRTPRWRAIRRLSGKRAGLDTADREGIIRQVVRQLIDTQPILDRAVAAVTTRRAADLSTLMGPSAWVHILTSGDEWKGRGRAAQERLMETIAADEALNGRQVRGNVHLGLPTSTAVLTFAGPDGSRHERVIAVTIEKREVTGVTYYQLPGN